MFLADQLDNPNVIIPSGFKHYLFDVDVVKKKPQFNPFLSGPLCSFTHALVPKKHTFAWEVGDDTNTLHTTVYKTDN